MFPYAEADGPLEWGEVTLALLLVNTMVFGAQRLLAPEIVEWLVLTFSFVPARPTWYTWLTSQFLHADPIHLFGNAYALWIFGHRAEKRLKALYFPLYLAGGCCANLALWLADPRSTALCLGASGAISAVMGLYVVLFPNARLKFLALIGYRHQVRTFTMSALLFGIGYLLLEAHDFAGDPNGARTLVAHGAHVGGLLFGAAVGLILRGRSPAAPSGSQPSGASLSRSLAPENGEAPTPEAAFQAAGQLAQQRRWAPARALLERLVEENPGHPLAPEALRLAGYVYQAGYLDTGAAFEAYAQAAVHPAATTQGAADARARLEAARQALATAAFDFSARGEPCALIVESTRPLGERRRDEADEILAAARLPAARSTAGVLAVSAAAPAAGAAAATLREAGVPAAVVPSRWTTELPAVQMIQRVAVLPEGLMLDEARLVRWPQCVLVAAYAVHIEVSAVADQGPGILDLDFRADHPEPATYVDKLTTRMVLEIVSADGRWRWIVGSEDTPELEARRTLGETAAAIISADQGALLNDGLGACAIGGAVPPHCRIYRQSLAEFYIGWQTQVARLRQIRQARA